ncbi:ferrochelatase [Propionigenium maris DSM 9537]|uniref:precorrin-2 dehydrogenase n=1 Tax=Propionigenium maris DSM 9537 TaxID=1123000 RepID=A0A9W6GPT8_9FUSO|nr:bifunctional precorrin-2 dehydrogenase/sirohydrochlorin ferrochelatase [Propionigenium maris]GLI57866.1 ferrochelatase [Propionigenium maris DSM 9537]
MNENFFPGFIALRNKRCLVVGAGNIAHKKIAKLLNYGAKVKVITREIKKEEIKNLEGVEVVIGDFTEKDLENVFLVVAATDNPDFNEWIYKLCEERNILINNITSKNSMNFRFSAVYEDENIQVAVSAKGYPKKSVVIRNRIAEFLKGIKF